MKVLFLTISPKRGGGVITKAAHLARFLLSRGCTIEWVAPAVRGAFPRYWKALFDAGNIEYWEFPVPLPFRPLEALGPWRDMKKRADVYQVISGFCADGATFARQEIPYFCWTASTIASEKAPPASHLGVARNCIARLSNNIMARMERRYAHSAYKVFANSEFTKGRLVSDLSLDSNSIDILYPPVDLERIDASPDAHSSTRPYFLFVGIFSPRKNIGLLLRAFSLASKSLPHHQLILVGKPGQFLEQFQRLSQELGIADKVIFAGEQFDTVSFMRGAVATVLTSVQEGFGMVLAESLACATPVISTRCGGAEEVVDTGLDGLLVASTPESIAAAMIQLATSVELRNTMGQYGRFKVEKKFSLERIGEKLLSSYEQYLSVR